MAHHYFPKCQLYIVSYPEGGGGNLLVSVISHMLFPEKETSIIDNGTFNAHSMTDIAKELPENGELVVLSKYSPFPLVKSKQETPLLSIVNVGEDVVVKV